MAENVRAINRSQPKDPVPLDLPGETIGELRPQGLDLDAASESGFADQLRTSPEPEFPWKPMFPDLARGDDVRDEETEWGIPVQGSRRTKFREPPEESKWREGMSDRRHQKPGMDEEP